MDLPNFPSVGPEIWGRSFWEFLDAIVATFPRDNPAIEHRNAVYELMQSLRFLLPCPVCRKHYCDFLQRNPLDHALLSRKTLIEFYFLLKKDVAGRTGKNLAFKNPDDLWQYIVRRLKLARTTATSPATLQASQISSTKKPFRVPTRIHNNNQNLNNLKKGCGCKK